MMIMVFRTGRSGIKMTTEDIKTQAGRDMFKYFNDNYGSSIWGPVLEGIKAIEREMILNQMIDDAKSDNLYELTTNFMPKKELK